MRNVILACFVVGFVLGFSGVALGWTAFGCVLVGVGALAADRSLR